ncbi:sugar ABC transporter substrate-binding protein [Marinibaculum pumilum]|uniref:Sugar ABC transporter substrate-binding protein n=1 Tax=Marinibaculum pumilum TaxID=1766165 RepID=A0ABV7L1Z4_9PROT
MSTRSVPVRVLACAAALSALAFATPGAKADGLADAKAMVAAHSSLPEKFAPPNPPFDAKACVGGKKLLVIPVSSANPFTKNIATAMTAAGKEVGLEVVEWENQARPTQWVQGFDYAINNGFDAIDLLGGVNPAVLGPQIKAAKAAGLKVFTSHFYDTTQDPDPSLDGTSRIPFHKAGEIMANWAIAQTGGKVNAIIIGSDEIVPTAPFVEGIKKTLDANCADCKYTYVNAPVPEWSTKIQSSVQSGLISDPTVNYILPIYDSMSQFVIPAIKITGKTGQVKIATFNGTPFVIDAIQKGEVEMDVGESLGWIARGILDNEMRLMCGMEASDQLYVPFYLFTEANAKDAGTPADYDRGYGDMHVGGYRKLWGVE